MKNLIIAASCLALAHAQGPPVFTLGPQSDYNKAPAATATPRNHEISILPKDLKGGVPDEGIDVFFGSDLQGAIKSVLDSDACKDEGVSSDCSAAVGKAIDAQHALTVEKRIVGIDDLVLLTGAALAAFVGIAIKWSQEESPQHVHIPAGDLKAVQSHTDSNFAVATASGAAPVTISVTPTSAPSAGSVSILTEDDGEHKSGDAVVTLPSGMANLIDQIIIKSPDAGECLKQGPQKRSVLERESSRTAKPLTPGLLETIRRLAEYTLSSSGSEDLVGEVDLIDGAILPTINDPGVIGALEQTQEFAAQLNAFHGKAKEFIDERSMEIFYTVWAYCSLGMGAQGISPFHIPPTHKTAEDSEDDDDKCPSDLQCADDKCKGENDKCTAEGENKDCDCSSDDNAIKVVKHHGGDKETLQWYSDMLQQMLGEGNDDAGRAPHMLKDVASDMTGDDFKALARDQLCDNLMRRVESGDSNQYSMYPNGVSLSINRDGLDGETKWGCKISEAQSCKNALNDMANGDSGRRGDGGKWMAAEITKDTGCGNVTINFPKCSNCETEPKRPTLEENPINTPPKPEIIAGNSQCDTGNGLANSIGVSVIIDSLLEKGGACELDGKAGKNGDDECTELGKHTSFMNIANARIRFCAPAGNEGYYMQCSNLAAEAQQFFKDCSSDANAEMSWMAGRKYVNGDGFYILITHS